MGSEISFATNGSAHVHLTGYMVQEDDEFDMSNLSDEVDEEESLEEEEETVEKGKKRKRQSVDSPKKKPNVSALFNDTLDSKDSDDSDVHSSDFDSDNDEEAGEEEEGDDDDEDVEEEEEDEEGESSEEVEEEERVVKEKPKQQNGTLSKKDKKKLQQQGKKEAQSPESPPAKEKGKAVQAKEGKSPKKEQTPPKKRTLEGGVVIEEVRVGNGPVAKVGRTVQVYYEGRFKNNNKMFDSTTKGPGFKFRLGRQEVIKGWDVGVEGMKVGGKRKIICPPSMAYVSFPPNSISTTSFFSFVEV